MAKTWKASELAVARTLGGERVPITGRQRGDAPDVWHPWLAIEVKSWKTGGPAGIRKAMAQAKASADTAKRRTGVVKLPIAIIHHDHKSHSNDLVVLTLGDFQLWFGSTSQPAAAADIPAQENEQHLKEGEASTNSTR